MSLWLTKEELIERTGYKRHSAQCRELARQGMQFTVRHDGFPLVDRWQFEQRSEPEALPKRAPRLRFDDSKDFNWDALRPSPKRNRSSR